MFIHSCKHVTVLEYGGGGGEEPQNTPLQTSRPIVRIWWSPCADVYFCCCRLLFRSEVCGSQSSCSHSIRTDGSVTYFLQFFPPGTNTKCSIREQHCTARNIHERTYERTGVRWFSHSVFFPSLFYSLSLKSCEIYFMYLFLVFDFSLFFLVMI